MKCPFCGNDDTQAADRGRRLREMLDEHPFPDDVTATSRLGCQIRLILRQFHLCLVACRPLGCQLRLTS
mgnify:CR=1 FL=1